jgi:hypothetical protein
VTAPCLNQRLHCPRSLTRPAVLVATFLCMAASAWLLLALVHTGSNSTPRWCKLCRCGERMCVAGEGDGGSAHSAQSPSDSAAVFGVRLGC